MSDLTEFLLARIAEVEAEARRAFEAVPPPFGAYGRVITGEVDYLAVDPDHVLAECEAKRRIVERATRALRWDQDADGNPAERVADWAWSTLEDLALPYADHPDYRQEWKP